MTVPVNFLGRATDAMKQGRVKATRAGARRLNSARILAAEAYPPMEAMRDRARQIRLHTLANLDRYLDEFANSVEALGGSVFFAENADEAVEHVTSLAVANGAKLAIKSKSMVTEEIELNPGLEDVDVEVVETDLGEFIIQLADDRPSHIIAPVLHKTRFEIGELFRDELKADYTDDPTELNAIARRHLREIFLSADIGISGVNFGVASTGSICTVTNEGNGRLTTTAPRVHVAVMGMERVVPDIGSLGVMLEVLARSGTGQALSVYTNVVTGARRRDDPDGPEEFHVVILDNGRSEVLAGHAAEILGCIRCGACLNICPVYQESGGHSYGSVYSGPIGAVVTPAMLGVELDLPYASTLCGACREACPIRIDIPRMLLDLRATGTEKPLERALSAYTSAATHPRAWRALLRSGAFLGRIRAKDGWIESIPGAGSGWTDHRAMPSPGGPSFHSWWKKQRGASNGT